MPISFSSPTNRDSGARGAGVTAVLGPTNTGKTHLAIERMLGHSSGIIGLPLRLLAREVYNKVAARVGAEAVALVTGEEKIKPPSPRTRNAQVALYQSGDVEYLVATDAIGMGLNLDVDHVAFASDRKFDGYQFRRLNPAELAQIAGRAGRAIRNGTFGTTGRCPPFETELAQALESHSFEPIKVLQWRNTALDFFSIGALQASLAETPKENGLTRAPVAEDILVLEHAVRDDDVRALATTPEAIARLWEVCQVPDYRKISPATHAELVMTLYGFLMREKTIPIDWFARQVNEADHTDGDIDTLSNRIAHIRTWTFAANRPDWLADPEHWQEVTRAVEDKLSDALHERLTERFVDRRTSVLQRRLRENTALDTEIRKTGEVVVEGHVIGRLDGFMFTPDAS